VYIEGSPTTGGDHLSDNRAKIPLLWGSLQRPSGRDLYRIINCWFFRRGKSDTLI
jgi:hypothetical protein